MPADFNVGLRAAVGHKIEVLRVPDADGYRRLIVVEREATQRSAVFTLGRKEIITECGLVLGGEFDHQLIEVQLQHFVE